MKAKFDLLLIMVLIFFVTGSDCKSLTGTTGKAENPQANNSSATHRGIISLSIPSAAKIFYVSITDSADNIVSSTYLKMGDTSGQLASPAARFQFDPKVWAAPKTYTDVPSSVAYSGLKAFYYDGLDYMQHATKVFAYIGFPANASKTHKVPAVVLVHGGGGTAFPQWVKIWNDKGYAAIAMDLEGRQPVVPGESQGVIHALNGPNNTNFGDVNTTTKDQWMYHAVSDVFLAYSLLKADERVDTNLIGITGISWGGIITSIAIGNSDCFAFAIPVYGCGYLNGSKGWMKNLYNDAVATQWDASKWLATAKTPTLWVNGDSDDYFSIDATTKSALSTKNSQISLIPRFPHSHSDGWSPQQIYSFANSVAFGSKGLIKISKNPTVNDLTLEFDTLKSFGFKSAMLCYSKDVLTYDSNSKLTNVWYKQMLSVSGWTGIENSTKSSKNFNLWQNFPNPFNPNTMLQYDIEQEGRVTLKVYKITGEEVATLVNQQQERGSYSVCFNASSLASGVYLYRLQEGDISLTKKLILMK